ncbi:J domain-containing protein [Bacillus thuringiensis]|uniref:J domain-containing protein n=1 Tax=Bacillus thuringiensis TaxID=1428 RepID=UPI003F6D9318
MKDYYEILGVSRGATKQVIKKRYRQLAQEYHPDKHAGNPLEKLAEEKFKEIKKAYDAIMSEFSEDNYQQNSNYNSGNTYNSNNKYEELVGEIQHYFNKRMWYPAIEMCDKAIKSAPNEPMLYVYKAVAYYELGNFTQAVYFFNVAQNKNWVPHPEDLWSFALSYMELGKYNQAIPLIENVISSEGEAPNLVAHLAYCYEAIGNNSKSEQYWGRLEMIDPNNEWLQQRKQSMKVGNQYVNKSDAAVGACGVCAVLECLFDCC